MFSSEILAAHMIKVYQELREEGKLHRPLKKLRLYRLLFLVHLDYFQKTNKLLINEEMVHFKLGPVVHSVYRTYLDFYFEEIKKPAGIMQFKGGKFITLNPLDSESELSSELVILFSNLFQKYDDLDEFELTDLTFEIIEKKERGTILTIEDMENAKRKLT